MLKDADNLPPDGLYDRRTSTWLGVRADMSIASEREHRLAAEPFRSMSPVSGFVSGARSSIKAVWERRELLHMLVRREIRARYKDSVLGMIWSLIRPLIQLLIYYMVIGRFLGAQRSIPSFAIYVFTGLSIWQLFSEIIATGTGSIVSNGGIIKKIQLPREIFPLSAVGSALFNFSIQLLILLPAALLTSGLSLNGRLLYLPASIAIVVIWGSALAFLLSAANVYLRDIQYLVEVGLIIGFWLSPIVYSYKMVASVFPTWATELYLANPVTLAVMALQKVTWKAGEVVTDGIPNYPGHLAPRVVLVLIIGTAFLALSQRLFDRMQANFAQEI